MSRPRGILGKSKTVKGHFDPTPRCYITEIRAAHIIIFAILHRSAPIERTDFIRITIFSIDLLQRILGNEKVHVIHHSWQISER